MLLKIAQQEDYPDIRKLRDKVFRVEMKIQENDFRDPFDDHEALVFIVENRGMKIGTARIVFSKAEREFYFSYFLVLSDFRCQMTGLYLLGGLLYFMRFSGIERIVAHAHKDVVPLYAKFGFEMISEAFKKPGFICEWVKMEYVLGTNRQIEEYSIGKVHHFLNQIQLASFCEKYKTLIKTENA